MATPLPDDFGLTQARAHLRLDPDDADPMVALYMQAATIIDPDGKRLFTEEDIEALQQKSGQVLGRLADAAFRINAVGPAADEAAAKNFKTDQSDASGSGSLATSVKASGKSNVK